MSASAGGRVLFESPLVQRVAEVVGASRSLPRVLDRIVAALAEHGYPGAGISLINERDELYVVAFDGPRDEEILALRLPVGQGIMGKVAAESRSLLIADLAAPGGPAPANRDVGAQARLRSIVAVPIVTEHTVIGVLEIDSTQPGRFTSADLAVFEQVADEIAVAVKEAAPLELAGALLRRRVLEVLLLQETTQALAAAVDVGDVYQTIVRYVGIGLGAPHVFLLSLGEDGTTVVAEYGEPYVVAENGRITGPSLDVVADATASGALFVPADDVERALRLPEGTLTERAIAAVPVRAGSEFDGALLAASLNARGFDPAEVQLLEGIAGLAGLAISNAERYRRLLKAADTDAVTHLQNRARFERELAALNGSAFAVLSLDLDRLRHTNDTYGHEAGDAVLEHVGEALDKLVLGRGPVARVGADEFAILLPDVDAVEACRLAEEIREAMYGLVPPYGTARISIGVAAAMAGADARATWSEADVALARAKQYGRDRVVRAGSDMPPALDASTPWDGQLVQLIDSRGIESVYQGIVRLRDHAVVAYEALARPLGADPCLSVESLFSAAHRKGWSRELDWLGRRAAMTGAGGLPDGLPLFINISAGALVNPIHDVDQMLMLMEFAGRSPRDIVLEITEREAVEDLDRFRQVLAAYRSNGFRFAIDDVGEGRATLAVLAAAEPEYVKIARSLTVSADALGPRSAICAVVSFARSSGAIIIAEGIENEHHADVMASMGVEHGQGWWLGPPERVSARGPA